MERIICGKITLFREICPRCKEYNLSGESKFICNCGQKYNGTLLNRTRIEAVNKRRKHLKKYEKILKLKQKNKCYWCGRDFGRLYLKKQNSEFKLRELKAHVDHIIPFSFEQRDEIDNLCASCSVCNLWKSSKMFEKEEECKIYLKRKWETAIEDGKVKLH